MSHCDAPNLKPKPNESWLEFSSDEFPNTWVKVEGADHYAHPYPHLKYRYSNGTDTTAYCRGSNLIKEHNRFNATVKHHNDANYNCPANALADTIPGKCICKPHNDDSPWPEHEKLMAVKTESQAIGDFLEWCSEEGMLLASYPKRCNAFTPDILSPCGKSITDLIAEFFEIDIKKIENEKQEMVDILQV